MDGAAAGRAVEAAYVVVGATQFAVVNAGEDDGVEISCWLYPRDRAHAAQFGRVVQIVDFFSSTIGRGIRHVFRRALRGARRRRGRAARRDGRRARSLPRPHRRVDASHPRPSITDLTKLLNRLNYQKGAWVLHMLRGVIGDDAFFAGIREYHATYRNGNASTGELRDHGAAPRAAAGVVLPAMDLRAGARRQRVLIDERRERFELESPLQPSAVVLDPDHWILRE